MVEFLPKKFDFWPFTLLYVKSKSVSTNGLVINIPNFRPASTTARHSSTLFLPDAVYLSKGGLVGWLVDDDATNAFANPLRQLLLRRLCWCSYAWKNCHVQRNQLNGSQLFVKSVFLFNLPLVSLYSVVRSKSWSCVVGLINFLGQL